MHLATKSKRAAFVAATTPEASARAIGMNGRRVRNVLRGKLGVMVSKGDAYSPSVRGKLYDLLTKNAKNDDAKSKRAPRKRTPKNAPTTTPDVITSDASATTE